jgi:4'-phosphopantetheinyl transferase
VRPGARSERRSPARPEFVEGWHKAVRSKVERAQSASPIVPEPSARVEIWIANPDALMKSRACLKALSKQDWPALNRIRNPANRRSAIAARVLLRIGLSQASGRRIAPPDWRFDTAAHDRPVVAEGLPQMHFSVSHTDELAMVAVSPTLDIGIDVECVDQHVDPHLIAEFCHLDEHHSVGGLPRPQEIREFIRLWTLKEAYAKLLGLGHSLDFKSVKFVLDPIDLTLSGGGGNARGRTQFETFYVSYKHALFHASLAIRNPAASAGSTEVQIVSLAGAQGRDVAHATPLSELR